MENANKKFRYSIRKFKVGVGSVLIATCLLGAGVSTPTAFATTETSTATQVEAAQPTSETEPTVQITGTVSTENTNSESKVAPEVKEEAPVAEKAETATNSAEQNVVSEPEKTEEPTPAPAALTSEAKEEVSTKTQENVEVKNSPLQDVQNLLKDVERELEELEVFTEYDASVYRYQKSLWDQLSKIGKMEMDRALTLKEDEDSVEIKEVHESLFEFGNQIKMERFTRQVAPYLEKYSDDEFIKNEYHTNLEQSDKGSYASQGGNTFKAYVDRVEQSVERIVKRGEELERKNLKTEVPKEAPKVAEKPKLDFKVQTRTTYKFLDFETKEQEDPNLPLGKKEERQKGERGEESETYQDVIVGDKIVASTLISQNRKAPVDHLIAKGTLVEKHPDTAPTAPEKPKLDFTVKERVEREILDYMVEEQDDASLPLGQTKVLREGQKGELVKKYQDVIVEGKVIESKLLSEDRKAPVNRLIAKNILVEKHPDTAPTAPEKPKLDFTVKERVEREILDYMVEEQDDASLPLGQTKVLREGQKGELVKKYQDVIVGNNVIASNLLSEDRKAPVNRLIAKGTLVEKMPDAPAPKAEEEVPTPAPVPETPKAEEEAPAPTPMPETKQPEMEQPKAEDMPKEEMPKAEQPKAEDSAPKTAVPEVAPKTAEKPKLDFTTKERKVEEALPIKEEIRYDAGLALGKSYLLQEGKAGKKVSVYQDVIVDGKAVATNLLSETVVEGQNRILVKGSLEMKKEEVKTTPSVQSNPAMSHKGAPSANKATLPATGEQRNNLALVGLGLAGISLAVVATAINKKSKDQI
ncbi:YSIRK-type signal peptide-containing protein [Streptococcus suis]|uniref:LPXTG-motif cell wall anchor domain-containing protein n=1 Tax=Streptococcus suis TaxID=1307 RepID=A0A0Z8SUR2_STRSU|nr:G5 domain-containing protein [Streptococcus suis]NQN59804.1 YSIRK-type signal peptide-containing protein [Streptococcus suis]NQP75577.1 YSIRK-type signal peptide-containing protein [Streptococcus suis]NQP77575.1 YSIRK-type signal peptide-containing protein [Streptococcus suis]NQP91916.1 YSIRK-type signal peptide-containing protein [Streptococcus suis]NQP93872.1 YSIRK-type signal peptide-containing protein [Streptococcus suis]